MKLETNKGKVSMADVMLKSKRKAYINSEMSTLIMDMLAKIYVNPLEAAIREYVSNASDAHLEAGVTRPVELRVPCDEDPVLEITDYGNGLNMMEILGIYGNFGSSTKRNSDELIGGFGIGSKSGLAISNCVEVISVKDGILNHFVLKRENMEIFIEFLRRNEDAGDMPSGTTVRISVNSSYLQEEVYQNYKRTAGMNRRFNAETLYTNMITRTIAGWPAKKLIASCQNPNINERLNSERIPDIYMEFKNAYMRPVINPPTHKVVTDDYYSNIRSDKVHYEGFLVGDVFYSVDRDSREVTDNGGALVYASDTISKDFIEAKRVRKSNNMWGWPPSLEPFVLKLDIAKTKVKYSREQLDFIGSKEMRSYIDEVAKSFTKELNDICETLETQITDLYELVKRKLISGIKPVEIFEKAYINNYTRMKLSFSNNKLSDMSGYFVKDAFDLANHERFMDIKAIVIDDTDPSKKILSDKTYMNHIRDIYMVYMKELLKTDGPAKDFYLDSVNPLYADYSKYNKTWNNDMLLIRKSLLDKILIKDFMKTYSMEELEECYKTLKEEYKKSSPKINIKDPLAKAYVLDTKFKNIKFLELSEIKNLIDEEANKGRDIADKFLLLEPKSKYAFTSKSASEIKKIAKLSNRILIYAKKKKDYDTLVATYPNLPAPDDLSFEAQLTTKINDYSKIASSKFAQLIGEHCMLRLESGMIKEPLLDLRPGADLREMPLSETTPLTIKKLFDSILKASDSSPLKDLKSACQNTLVQNNTGINYRFLMMAINSNEYLMTEAMYDDIIEKIAVEEKDVLDALERIYA